MDGSSVVSPGAARPPFILAVDVGTSSVRSIIYDVSARAIGDWESHYPYRPHTTADGGVEFNASGLFDCVIASIDDVMGSTRSAPIDFVACDTFWHSLLGVDGEGEPVTPLLTWADTRSSTVIAELRQRVDERAVHQRTGAVLHSSYFPAKLLWLHTADPECFHRASFWMSFGEFLYLKLFGNRRVSVSMASGTGLFNQRTCNWDSELLHALPVKPEQLSLVAEFSENEYSLRAQYAQRWPTLSGIPWFLPVGDGAANNIGSGGYHEDTAVVMIGTSGALRIVRPSTPGFEIPRGLWTYRVDRKRLLQGGALSDGGNVFDWLIHTLQVKGVKHLEATIATLEPDSHGLTVLPFLAGERSPFWESAARAAMVGMTLDTKAEDVVLAWLEAIAFRFGLVYEILKRGIRPPTGIIGSGVALVHSPVWMQIVCDVLDQEVAVSAVAEATSRGTALLALECSGAITDLSQRPAPLGQLFSPRRRYRGVYAAAMDRQQRLYDVLLGADATGILSVSDQRPGKGSA